MRYLLRRSAYFYARIPIPLKLQPRIPLTVIKISLKTGDKATAEHRCRLIVAQTHAVFKQLENGAYSHMTPEQIRSLIKKHIQRLLVSSFTA